MTKTRSHAKWDQAVRLAKLQTNVNPDDLTKIDGKLLTKAQEIYAYLTVKGKKPNKNVSCDTDLKLDNLRKIVTQDTGLNSNGYTKEQICQVRQEIIGKKLTLPPLVLSANRTYMLDKKSPLSMREYKELFGRSTVGKLKSMAKKVGISVASDATQTEMRSAIKAKLKAMDISEPIILGQKSKPRASRANTKSNFLNNSANEGATNLNRVNGNTNVNRVNTNRVNTNRVNTNRVNTNRVNTNVNRVNTNVNRVNTNVNRVNTRQRNFSAGNARPLGNVYKTVTSSPSTARGIGSFIGGLLRDTNNTPSYNYGTRKRRGFFSRLFGGPNVATNANRNFQKNNARPRGNVYPKVKTPTTPATPSAPAPTVTPATPAPTVTPATPATPAVQTIIKEIGKVNNLNTLRSKYSEKIKALEHLTTKNLNGFNRNVKSANTNASLQNLLAKAVTRNAQIKVTKDQLRNMINKETRLSNNARSQLKTRLNKVRPGENLNTIRNVFNAEIKKLPTPKVGPTPSPTPAVSNNSRRLNVTRQIAQLNLGNDLQKHFMNRLKNTSNNLNGVLKRAQNTKKLSNALQSIKYMNTNSRKRQLNKMKTALAYENILKGAKREVFDSQIKNMSLTPEEKVNLSKQLNSGVGLNAVLQKASNLGRGRKQSKNALQRKLMNMGFNQNTIKQQLNKVNQGTNVNLILKELKKAKLQVFEAELERYGYLKREDKNSLLKEYTNLTTNAKKNELLQRAKNMEPPNAPNAPAPVPAPAPAPSTVKNSVLNNPELVDKINKNRVALKRKLVSLNKDGIKLNNAQVMNLMSKYAPNKGNTQILQQAGLLLGEKVKAAAKKREAEAAKANANAKKIEDNKIKRERREKLTQMLKNRKLGFFERKKYLALINEGLKNDQILDKIQKDKEELLGAKLRKLGLSLNQIAPYLNRFRTNKNAQAIIKEVTNRKRANANEKRAAAKANANEKRAAAKANANEKRAANKKSLDNKRNSIKNRLKDANVNDARISQALKKVTKDTNVNAFYNATVKAVNREKFVKILKSKGVMKPYIGRYDSGENKNTILADVNKDLQKRDDDKAEKTRKNAERKAFVEQLKSKGVSVGGLFGPKSPYLNRFNKGESANAILKSVNNNTSARRDKRAELKQKIMNNSSLTNAQAEEIMKRWNKSPEKWTNQTVLEAAKKTRGSLNQKAAATRSKNRATRLKQLAKQVGVDVKYINAFLADERHKMFTWNQLTKNKLEPKLKNDRVILNLRKKVTPRSRLEYVPVNAYMQELNKATRQANEVEHLAMLKRSVGGRASGKGQWTNKNIRATANKLGKQVVNVTINNLRAENKVGANKMQKRASFENALKKRGLGLLKIRGLMKRFDKGESVENILKSLNEAKPEVKTTNKRAFKNVEAAKIALQKRAKNGGITVKGESKTTNKHAFKNVEAAKIALQKLAENGGITVNSALRKMMLQYHPNKTGGGNDHDSKMLSAARNALKKVDVVAEIQQLIKRPEIPFSVKGEWTKQTKRAKNNPSKLQSILSDLRGRFSLYNEIGSAKILNPKIRARLQKDAMSYKKPVANVRRNLNALMFKNASNKALPAPSNSNSNSNSNSFKNASNVPLTKKTIFGEKPDNLREKRMEAISRLQAMTNINKNIRNEYEEKIKKLGTKSLINKQINFARASQTRRKEQVERKKKAAKRLENKKKKATSTISRNANMNQNIKKSAIEAIREASTNRQVNKALSSAQRKKERRKKAQQTWAASKFAK